ncbi:hypothetical protein ATANTOWER_024972 [Ataeniobius toweri]|uniref:NADH dehydrogenase subunit 6 n=1 Tax=Ataeniobius toweri TaxID=208326 RepID=A0ABU7C0E5_9TELE|nr:hypothetical protein [Ataeniobius toweri]
MGLYPPFDGVLFVWMLRPCPRVVCSRRVAYGSWGLVGPAVGCRCYTGLWWVSLSLDLPGANSPGGDGNVCASYLDLRNYSCCYGLYACLACCGICEGLPLLGAGRSFCWFWWGSWDTMGTGSRAWSSWREMAVWLGCGGYLLHILPCNTLAWGCCFCVSLMTYLSVRHMAVLG